MSKNLSPPSAPATLAASQEFPASAAKPPSAWSSSSRTSSNPSPSRPKNPRLLLPQASNPTSNPLSSISATMSAPPNPPSAKPNVRLAPQILSDYCVLLSEL